MAKFEYRLVEKNNTWTAEITRKVSARKTSVTKSKADFASEAEAAEWAQTELKDLSTKVSKRRRVLSDKKHQLKKELQQKASDNDE